MRRKQKPDPLNDKTVYIAVTLHCRYEEEKHPCLCQAHSPHSPERCDTFRCVWLSHSGRVVLCWNDRYDTNRVSNAWVKPGVVPCSGEVFFLRSVDCGFIILIVFKGCFINYLLYILLFICFFHYDISALLLRGRWRSWRSQQHRWSCPWGPTLCLMSPAVFPWTTTWVIKLDSPLVVVQMNEFIPKTIPLNKPADGGEPVSSGSTLGSRVQAPGYFSFHPARITRRLFQSGTCKLRVWVLLQKYVTTQVWKTQTDREHSTVEKWW